MPRHTRSRTSRRLEAFAQARCDEQVQRLAVQLHGLWRQHLADVASGVGDEAHGDDDRQPATTYHDPRLFVRLTTDAA